MNFSPVNEIRKQDRFVMLTGQKGFAISHKYPESVFYDFDEFAKLGTPLPTLPSLVPQKLQKIFEEYKESLFFSPNFLLSDAPLTDLESGQYHHPAEFCALCRSPSGKQKIIVLSDMDAAALKNSLLTLQEKKAYSISLLSLRGEVIASSDPECTKDSLDKNEEVKDFLSIIKFLNGQLDYSSEQHQILQRVLMKECKTADEIKERAEALESFAKRLVSFQPGLGARYSSSDLHLLLDEIYAPRSS